MLCSSDNYQYNTNYHSKLNGRYQNIVGYYLDACKLKLANETDCLVSRIARKFFLPPMGVMTTSGQCKQASLSLGIAETNIDGTNSDSTKAIDIDGSKVWTANTSGNNNNNNLGKKYLTNKRDSINVTTFSPNNPKFKFRMTKMFMLSVLVICTLFAVSPKTNPNLIHQLHDAKTLTPTQVQIVPLAFSLVDISNFGFNFGFRGEQIAYAEYVDDFARFSRTLGKFLDLLLEKVNFFAELAIEAALDEQCELTCMANDASSLTGGVQTAETGTGSKAVVEETKMAPDSLKESSSLMSFNVDGKSASKLSSNSNTSNSTEGNILTNSGEFVKKLEKRVGDEYTSLYGIAETVDVEQRISAKFNGCKVLNLNIDAKELPVKVMEKCCITVRDCYSQCGIKKRDCDLKFQSCLHSVCRSTLEVVNQESADSVSKRPNISKRNSNNDDDDDNDGDLGESEGAPMEDESEIDGQDNGDGESGEEDRRRRRSSRQISGVRQRQGIEVDELVELDDNISSPPRTQKDLEANFKACKLGSKLLIIGNLAFGCQQYKDLQKASNCCKTNISRT